MARGESSGDALCHTATMGKIGPKLKEEIVNEQTYKLTNLQINLQFLAQYIVGILET
jgi:hypothetical protein